MKITVQFNLKIGEQELELTKEEALALLKELKDHLEPTTTGTWPWSQPVPANPWEPPVSVPFTTPFISPVIGPHACQYPSIWHGVLPPPCNICGMRQNFTIGSSGGTVTVKDGSIVADPSIRITSVFTASDSKNEDIKEGKEI